jgi:hypothetical protein
MLRGKKATERFRAQADRKRLHLSPREGSAGDCYGVAAGLEMTPSAFWWETLPLSLLQFLLALLLLLVLALTLKLA